jgi:Protein of unknown function (DUF3168)
MISADLQAALYTKLTGTVALMNLVTGVYDVVPQELAEVDPPADVFPYVIIGGDSVTPWDTDTELGFDTEINIHVWTRADSVRENKLIQKQIYLALHREALAITGYNTLTPSLIKSDCFLDADGLSQHGVISFRFLADII